MKVLMMMLTLAASTPALAEPAKLSNEMTDKLVDVCEAIENNHVNQFRATLKRHFFNLPAIKRGLKCNDQTAFEFAMSSGAFKIAARLADGRVEIRDLARAEKLQQGKQTS